MPIVLITLILLNIIFSALGYYRREILSRYAFHVGSILSNDQYDRLVSSMFLHAGLGHILFNMFALYSFGDRLEIQALGPWVFLAFYLIAGVAGNLFALLVNRNNPDYLAVGASGAVSGVIFASILIFPGGSVFIFPIPVPIPDWIFAYGFIAISIFGIGASYGNIGHEAHLGGAVMGIIGSVALFPQILMQSPLYVFGLTLPVVIFTVLIVVRPELLDQIRNRQR